MDSEVEQKILDNLRNCSINYIQEHTITLCQKCSGTGFYEYEEMVDYHKREYETHTLKCNNCNGDGRMISISEKIEVRGSEQNKIVPYLGNEKLSGKNIRENIRVKIDKRNSYLEREYPELKALTYSNYDDMLRIIEIERAIGKADGKG